MVIVSSSRPTQIDGARKKEHGNFYVGKRCVYVFKAKTRKAVPQKPYIKSRVRAIWGKVTRLHGSTGSVRARFHKNLPGHAMGQRIRIVSIPECMDAIGQSKQRKWLSGASCEQFDIVNGKGLRLLYTVQLCSQSIIHKELQNSDTSRTKASNAVWFSYYDD